MKIIHLTDIHIGQGDKTHLFASIVNNLILRKKSVDSNIILISGDIVDDGKEYQYIEAKLQLDKLRLAGFEIITLPGNHDYGSNGIFESEKSVELFKKYISGNVEYPRIVKIRDYTFVLLDSMYQEMIQYDIWGAQGCLGRDQLNKLSSILTDDHSLNKKFVIAMHHHPFFYNLFQKLRDDDEFKDQILAPNISRPNIKAVLFGHKHSEKRFFDEESHYKIPMIYAADSSTRVSELNKMSIPIIDLASNSISKFQIEVF